MRMLTVRDVAHKTGLGRSTIYGMVAAGTFPRYVKLGNATRWAEGAVNDWLAQRGAQQDTKAPGAMPWYPSAFLGATRGWPCCARLVYRELLEAQWDMGSLPNDEAQLTAIAQVSDECFGRAWPFVKRKFRLGRDGALRNMKLEQIRRGMESVTESAE